MNFTPLTAKSVRCACEVGFSVVSLRVPDPGSQNVNTHLSADDHAYIDAMESRRALSLRRRLMWFCIIGMFLMAIVTLGSIPELTGTPIEADPSATALSSASRSAPEGATQTGWWGIRPSTIILFVACSTLLAVFATGLIYTVRTRPYSESEAARVAEQRAGGSGRPSRVKTGRHRLVVALSFICIAVFAIEFPAEVAAQWSDLNCGSPAVAKKVMEQPDLAAWKIVNSYGIFYCLACVAVPMRWRESLRIAVPGLGLLLMTVILGLQLEASPTIGIMIGAFVYALIGTAWSAWRYADFDARLRAHALGTRYTDLTGQVSEISAELRDARRLHESLFPALAVLQGHPDTPIRVSFRYEPARQIGGDFLDVYREPVTEGQSGVTGVTVVIIDVSGHGVTAALAVNRLHGELRRFFARHPRAIAPSGEKADGGPGHLLAELNAYTCAALAEQGIFATAMVVHVAPPSAPSASTPKPGLIRWASAGHPTGFLARTDGTIADLESTATMLGVLPPDLFDPQEHSLPLAIGDRLVTYTDGAVESRDAHGQDYTPERLRKAFGDLTATPSAATLLDKLMDAVRAHRHGRITDDTLLVEVTVGSPTPSA